MKIVQQMSDIKYKLIVSEVEAKKAMKEFADSICKKLQCDIL